LPLWCSIRKVIPRRAPEDRFTKKPLRLPLRMRLLPALGLGGGRAGVGDRGSDECDRARAAKQETSEFLVHGQRQTSLFGPDDRQRGARL
jgi:hypothetical protein